MLLNWNWLRRFLFVGWGLASLPPVGASSSGDSGRSSWFILRDFYGTRRTLKNTFRRIFKEVMLTPSLTFQKISVQKDWRRVDSKVNQYRTEQYISRLSQLTIIICVDGRTQRKENTRRENSIRFTVLSLWVNLPHLREQFHREREWPLTHENKWMAVQCTPKHNLVRLVCHCGQSNI